MCTKYMAILMVNEKLTQEITDAMKALFDLTARIDERVKMLVISNEKIHNLFNSLEDKVGYATEKSALVAEKVAVVELKTTDIRSEMNMMRSEFKEKIKEEIVAIEDDHEAIEKDIEKITQIETRIAFLEKSSNSQENRWKMVVGYVIQTAWILVVCYLLYKLNLQTPPIP